jgi:hypothetical protein
MAYNGRKPCVIPNEIRPVGWVFSFGRRMCELGISGQHRRSVEEEAPPNHGIGLQLNLD